MTLHTSVRDHLTCKGTVSVLMASPAIPATALYRSGDEMKTMTDRTLVAMRGAATQATWLSGSAHAGENKKAVRREAPHRADRGGRRSQGCRRRMPTSTASEASPCRGHG